MIPSPEMFGAAEVYPLLRNAKRLPGECIPTEALLFFRGRPLHRTAGISCAANSWNSQLAQEMARSAFCHGMLRKAMHLRSIERELTFGILS